MIVQTKPIVQEGNNPPGAEDNYYDEEETLETVLGKVEQTRKIAEYSFRSSFWVKDVNCQ